MEPERSLAEWLRQWGDAPLPTADGDRQDGDALDSWAQALWPLPAWALQVRAAMPRWGFEMCAHRWLDGLEHCLEMIVQRRYWPCEAGHCGHMPGLVAATVLEYAQAVERWLLGQPPIDAETAQLVEWLGAPTHAKQVAARCFVDAVRTRLLGLYSADDWPRRVDQWRAACAPFASMQALFADHGLSETLENACGFRLLGHLAGYLRLIGSDDAERPELIHNCNGQLRFIWRYDPARYGITCGYLWGAYAYLQNWKADELASRQPHCAGAACYVQSRLVSIDLRDPLNRWLVAAFFQTIKVWCLRVIDSSSSLDVPNWAHDLPSLEL